VLARHWTEAGETEAAIAQWSIAGQAAQSRSAFKEALDNYQRALELVRLLAESAVASQQELQLAETVYYMLSLTKGYAAPETVTASDTLIAMAEKAGDPVILERSLRSRSLAAYISGDLRAAAAVGERALTISQQVGTPAGIGSGHTLLMLILLALGDLTGAECHFLAGRPYYEIPEYRQNPSGGIVACFAQAARIALLQGRTELAWQRTTEMRAAAAESNNLYFQAFADFSTAAMHNCIREYRKAEEAAARALDLAERNSLPAVAA